MNDATLKDALFMGMGKVAHIWKMGVPGTLPDFFKR